MPITEDRLRTLTQMTPDEHRFWAKVAIVDDDDSCWEWTAARHPEGYGHFQWKMPGEVISRAHNASRVAFIFTTGVVPGLACHICDNPPCVRPSHLYDGDHLTNSADRVSRGRARGKVNQRGEANDSAVLTEAIVRQGRLLRTQGLTYGEIAAILDKPAPTLALAIRGVTWSHLNDPPPAVKRPGGGRTTPEQVTQIRQARAEGVPLKILAEQYGLSISAISLIARSK